MDDTLISMMQHAQKGYACSQIIMLLALETRGESNPGLVRAMSGLTYGCGAGKGACGALSGAGCVLALYAGRGADEEEESPQLMVMLEELTDWFVARVADPEGAITCESIVGEEGPEACRMKCGALVAESFSKAMEILAANGFDPQDAG